MAKPRTTKPRKRERELHAKEQLANLLDVDTRAKLEKLRKDLEKGGLKTARPETEMGARRNDEVLH